jgi:hypothetical protein
MSQKLVVISPWMDKAEAQALVKKLIADGKYAKGQVKCSSYRWRDVKDHSKGYLARVHAVPGVCPEMEIGATGRKKKAEVATTEGSVMSSDVATLNLAVNFHQGVMAEAETTSGLLASGPAIIMAA